MSVTGSVSVEGISFDSFQDVNIKIFPLPFAQTPLVEIGQLGKPDPPPERGQTRISQHQLQLVPVILQPFISCLVAFSTSALEL